MAGTTLEADQSDVDHGLAYVDVLREVTDRVPRAVIDARVRSTTYGLGRTFESILVRKRLVFAGRPSKCLRCTGRKRKKRRETCLRASLAL